MPRHPALGGGRIVLIGGSSGIGLATAWAAAESGAGVVIAARDGARLEGARAKIAAIGRTPVEAHVLDASDERAVAAFFGRIGGFDHLANFVTAAPDQAVRAGMGLFADTTQDVLEAVFRNKFWSQIFTVRHALGRVRRSIVFVTGQAHRKSLPSYTAAAAADGAIEALARGLALELAPLRINVVAPGLIATPLMATLPAAVKAAFDTRTQAQPVPRMGAPEEIADAILWLMGNDYATGAVLEIDGGYKLT